MGPATPFVPQGVPPVPEPHLIQDPASKLNPKEKVSVVRYMVGQADWKKAACTADGAST